MWQRSDIRDSWEEEEEGRGLPAIKETLRHRDHNRRSKPANRGNRDLYEESTDKGGHRYSRYPDHRPRDGRETESLDDSRPRNRQTDTRYRPQPERGQRTEYDNRNRRDQRDSNRETRKTNNSAGSFFLHVYH